tara:strand:- start:2481 stop:3344 length:864 start_codon:yes stop_codon:yes gene_type:complete
MNVVTVYDYANDRVDAQKLLLCWLRHVNKFAHNCNLYLIHGTRISEQELSSLIEPEITNINVFYIKSETNPRKYNDRVLDNNFHVNFNLYNVMKVYESVKQPLIYMDLDAILLSDLMEWWDYVHEKSFIGTMHYPIGQNLNAGVYSLSGDCVMNFEELINRFFENKKEYKNIQNMCREQSDSWLGKRNYARDVSAFETDGNLKGSGDQALYTNYFVKTDETAYYHKHGPEWNILSSYINYEIDSNGFIQVNSFPNRMGFELDKVKILHGYAGGKQPLVDNVGLAYKV